MSQQTAAKDDVVGKLHLITPIFVRPDDVDQLKEDLTDRFGWRVQCIIEPMAGPGHGEKQNHWVLVPVDTPTGRCEQVRCLLDELPYVSGVGAEEFVPQIEESSQVDPSGPSGPPPLAHMAYGFGHNKGRGWPSQQTSFSQY